MELKEAVEVGLILLREAWAVLLVGNGTEGLDAMTRRSESLAPRTKDGTATRCFEGVLREEGCLTWWRRA